MNMLQFLKLECELNGRFDIMIIGFKRTCIFVMIDLVMMRQRVDTGRVLQVDTHTAP